ncbi:hypothetical protein GGH94_000823 [Coemansia aciculifera]|uniref:Uncharacterized protein n=1 Tax=Coemansia aciculifera TaxID=417176 RepID=A0A9W8IVE0_9FUNG|nr:hypothetical protein GGH94_000823 [Coemansia aciculifera]KAJ2876290.1 hypothetical protein GGH93_000867 [Coemansia aciculifera]
MHLPNLLICLLPALAIASQPEQKSAIARAPAGVSRADAYSLATQLGKDFVDALYEVRAFNEHIAETVASGQERARDDDDGESDDTSKLITKLASAFRPIMKEFLAVVNTVLPAGPQRQLVKAAADAVDSLLPLILKYALGL